MSGALSRLTASLGHHEDENKNVKKTSHEQSLTSILSTRSDRVAFLLLVADCIESMRKRLLSTFDANLIDSVPHKTLQSNNSKLHDDEISVKSSISNDGKTTSNRNRTDNSINQSGQTVEEDESDQERTETEYAKRMKEVSSESMQNLKNKSLQHFESWCEKVIQRVGEVVNSRESQQFEPTSTSSTQSNQTSLQAEPRKTDKSTSRQHQYTPEKTELVKLEEPKRLLILHSLLLLLLSLESYTAESRVLMLRVCSSLDLSSKILADDESKVAQGLLKAAEKQMNADEETKKQANENSSSRKWKVGLGAAAGAVLIGVTGGLAAPFIAAGVGSVMTGIGLGATATAGYLGALAGSAPLVGVLFGAYGGRMTGKMIDAYAKEVEDFAFIPVQKQSKMHFTKSSAEDRRLRVTIGISGWLTDEAEVFEPWQILGTDVEAFALRWELKALLSLGNALTIYIKSAAWGWAKKEIISRTIFATLSSALALPYGIAKAAKVIDNPFSVARSRSDRAGKVLADALINKVQGERPVTLIGYSLGARLIYSCLNELADRNAFGLVESVVLAGAAVPSDSLGWRKIRSVVAGRVVNVYSENDYLLGFLYRASSLQYGVAGLQQIKDVNGIENIDVSEFVSGHLQYRYLTGQILQKIGLEEINPAEVDKQILRLKEKEQEADKEQQENRQNVRTAEEETEDMEKKIEEKNKASQALDWVNDRIASLGFAGSKDTSPKHAMASS